MSSARFTIVEDYNWFTKTISRVINEELSEEHAHWTEPTHYYVDFLRFVNVATATTLNVPFLYLFAHLMLFFVLFSQVFVTKRIFSYSKIWFHLKHKLCIIGGRSDSKTWLKFIMPFNISRFIVMKKGKTFEGHNLKDIRQNNYLYMIC